MADYVFPEHVSGIRMNHVAGSRLPECTLVLYFEDHFPYAMASDLLDRGFNPEQIEAAVRTGFLRAAHFPERSPATDFFWNSASTPLLEQIARETVSYCQGQSLTEPIGGTYMSVAEKNGGSQQRALAGLIFGRETEQLREFPELTLEREGPLYVVRHSIADDLLSMLGPEQLEQLGQKIRSKSIPDFLGDF